ncbi:MAG: helix-turn-helix transcriptional regulator [Burkholderiales bacterium]|nr:helix-turn-helix transcriptional regulator [Burkholderiales bacterium]
MWSSKRSPGGALIRRLCTLGLPIEGIVPALMRALCREARCEAGVVIWFDEHGEISNLYAHDLPAPEALAGWLAAPASFVAPQEPETRPDSQLRRRKVVEICADGTAVGPGDKNNEVEPFCRHRRLCGMAVPSGVPLQRLCCAVIRDGTPVASLILYRTAAGPAFSSEDRITVKAAGRYLSLNAATVPAATDAAMYRVSGEHALLMCESDGRVVNTSANGFALLAQASGCPINLRTVPQQLERAGRDLIRRLLAAPPLPAGRDARGPLCAAASINGWGLFRFYGFFESDRPSGVVIERVDHLLIRLCESMWKLDLSVQQGETLLLLAQGMSHDRIAERMRIAPNTADYHVRQLFAKLGARTRDEAISCVLAAGETTVYA